MTRTGIRGRMRSWGRRQLYSFFSSLGTLVSHKLGTLMTVLVLGIAMAHPLGLYVTVKNLRALDLNHEDWGTLSVFMQHGVGAGPTAVRRPGSATRWRCSTRTRCPGYWW